jgi:uncharacterized metal-binding protein YceD (DUF177 family)
MTMIRPEFSRRIPVGRIGAGGLEQVIEASSDECRMLAERLQLPAVASLSCRFLLTPPLHGQVAAEGELRAEVTQVCVVSLEPFETTVAERFTLRFVPEQAGDLAAEDDIDPASPDELAYAGDAIDIGEAASEQLALALDPYPRMPGIALPQASGEMAQPAAPDQGSERPHPFAALARLRGGPRSGDI